MKLKRISIAIFASLALSQAYAVTPGAYVGVGAGYSSLADFTDTSKEGSGGLGGQVVAGYNFNPYFGLELGYRAFDDTTFSLDGYLNSKFNYSLKSVNLVGKLYLPLFNGSPFEYYSLIGISETYGKASGENGSVSNDALTGTVGIGFTYKINSHFTTSLEYSYTGGKDGDEYNIGIPAANLATLNILYNF